MNRKLIGLILLALVIQLLLLTRILLAEPEPFRFQIANDLFLHTDHFLTNQVDLKVGKFSLHNDMYSPDDKANPEIPYGDMPWDGYSYFEIEEVSKIEFGQEQVIKYRFGAVGEASGSETLQKFIHNDLSMGIPPTWAGQNPSEPTVDIVYSKRTREYVKSLIGDSMLESEYGVRAGNVKVSGFLRQKLQKHFYKYFNFHAGLQGEAIAYDTHLDGRLFQHDHYTVDKQPFVAEVRVGLEIYAPRLDDWSIDWSWIYQTERFEGQDGRHLWNMLTFERKF